MNFLKLISGCLGATLLMGYDFYKEWTIWDVLPKWGWIMLGFALLIFSVYAPKSKERITHFYVETAVLSYLIVLMIFLPYIGGHSSMAFNVKEPLFWIIILLTIWQLKSYKKRITSERKESKKS